MIESDFMFEKELSYFIREQSQLVKHHEGKTLALEGDAVVGVYENSLEAYLAIKRNGQLGKVMLQTCSAGPEAYTATVSTLGIIQS